MDKLPAGKVIIAGAGVAGLTAALAFARHGFHVEVFERSPKLEEVGAGFQLSPNATHILDRLGVLPDLLPLAVQPEAVILRAAGTLSELARVPLGRIAQARWGAPYLVAHRADLQRTLLAAVAACQTIRLVTGSSITDTRHDGREVTATVETANGAQEISGMLLVGADGVWSGLRSFVGTRGGSRFTGELAWRSVVQRDSSQGRLLANLGASKVVTAFLHPGFHLVAYPVRSGDAFNLVAFTPGGRIAEDWNNYSDISQLKRAMHGIVPALASLADHGTAWTTWPIHTVALQERWTTSCMALIGDAAHAMPPFAAQGAAMAIEDAYTLAARVASASENLPAALANWEASRRPRLAKVARRGALNHFAWHARGPVAFARNLVLKALPSDKLASDLDWLYGWDSSS
ncbi:FAD-binding protein [Pseudaminobacter arsenicus]|uniref:FAD-binding protein n=1 Tax=Borborobacter arsenicus TaxID=1851146 RepID=A0A432V777_9HYPH|nr:FAD-dependent monooxygenase [Pseudaminobacter arsenicus]RUM98005.1 FAD-binding protein [Pseudaminobacter arsenicus]